MQTVTTLSGVAEAVVRDGLPVTGLAVHMPEKYKAHEGSLFAHWYKVASNVMHLSALRA